MTKLLEKALRAVRNLSSSEQDEIAAAMLRFAERDEPEPIDPLHLPAVLKGLAQATDGEYSTDTEVESAFRRFESQSP